MEKGLDDELLKVEEVARILKISWRTIHNQLSLGKFPIPAKRILGRQLRFRRSDVEKYIDTL